MKKIVLLPVFLIFSVLLLQSCSDTPTESNTPNTQSVSGILVDEQAYRVPNALVEAYNTSNVRIATDTTDEEGSFVLATGEVPVADIRLDVNHEDFVAFSSGLEALAAGGKTSDMTLVMEHRDSACGRLSLLVRTDEGLNPLENVEVRLKRNGKLVTKSFTDVGGRLVFNYLVAGTYDLRFAKDGFKVVEREFTIQHCDSASFDIRMVATTGGGEDSCCDGVLELIVLKDGSRDPIGNALVKLWRNGAVVKDARTNENGVARIANICEGEYGVDVLREGYKSKEFSIVFGCDEVKGETILLESTSGNEDSCCHGILSVLVKNKNGGSPIPKALVKLYKGSTLKESGKTNDNGIVMMDGICKGYYQITVIREGFKSIEQNVEFGCNDRKEVTIELGQAEQDSCCRGILELKVFEAGTTTGLKGATVKLRRNGAIIETGTTNAYGTVIMDGICKGEYSILILREGYIAKEETVVFGCDEDKGVNIYLVRKNNDSCCTASLKLRIIDDATEAWIQGATVTIKLNGVVVATGPTNVEGWYLKEGLCAPREYTVIVSMTGYKSKDFRIGYEECNRKTETIRLVVN
jgi:hypothetical protein